MKTIIVMLVCAGVLLFVFRDMYRARRVKRELLNMRPIQGTNAELIQEINWLTDELLEVDIETRGLAGTTDTKAEGENADRDELEQMLLRLRMEYARKKVYG